MALYDITESQLETAGSRLDQLVAALKLLIDQPPTVRERQSTNAERAVLFLRRSVADGNQITDAQPFMLRDAVGALRAETYSLLLVALDRTSGAARWLCHGERAGANGFGVPVEGGETFTVRGKNNIDDFSLIAETGGIVEAVFYLFK